jgi:hypothetical protein
MWRLLAIAVMVVAGTVPALAQRGGGGSHGGSTGHSSGFSVHSGGFSGHSSGFAVRSAPSFRGSASMGRVGVPRPPQFANRSVAAYEYRRPINSTGYRYRRPYLPFYGTALPYAYSSTWLSPGCYDTLNCGYYDDSSYGSQAVAPAVDDPASQYAPPPPQMADAAPPDLYRPPYREPQPEPQPESAVTLIFKDGRPSQQIHNYMLTRTTLYVQDEHRQEIPVADLDLPATQKINQAAGVDFQLPGSAR